MPSSYVVSIVVAVFVVVGARLLLPVQSRKSGAGRLDVVLAVAGGLGLTFHCGAMFYRASVENIPGMGGLIDAVNAMGTASMVAYAVPAALLLAGIRHARAWLLILVMAGLTAVGVTMYNGSSLDTHLTSIVVAVALIALTVTDLLDTRRRGRGSPVTNSPVTTSR